MRLKFMSVGLFILAGCAEVVTDSATNKAVPVGIQQRLVDTVPANAETRANQRVVVLPPADVTIGNVSAYNGAYPIANTLAQEECFIRGKYAVRVSEVTPEGFLQFNCVPPGRAY